MNSLQFRNAGGGGSSPRIATTLPHVETAVPVAARHPVSSVPTAQTSAPWPMTFLPPAPDTVLDEGRKQSDESVDADVEAAMQRVRAQLDELAQTLRSASPVASQSSVDDLGFDPYDAMIQSDGYGLNSQLLAMTFVAMNLTAHVNRNNADAMKAATDRLAEINRERIETMGTERELRAQEANQVRKGGIVGAVFDWVIAAVDIAVGIGKTVAGFMTANPMLMAGGVLTLAAGVAGVGVALSNTMALVDKGRADQWRERAAQASTVQMSLSMAATVVDVTASVSRMASNAVMRGGKSVVGVTSKGKDIVRFKSASTRIGDTVENAVMHSAGATVRTAGPAALKQSAQTLQHVQTELKTLITASRRAKTLWRVGGKDALQ
ncbi:type III secretion system translocon subunit SctE, partial [Pandoraea pneumonica]